MGGSSSRSGPAKPVLKAWGQNVDRTLATANQMQAKPVAPTHADHYAGQALLYRTLGLNPPGVPQGYGPPPQMPSYQSAQPPPAPPPEAQPPSNPSPVAPPNAAWYDTPPARGWAPPESSTNRTRFYPELDIPGYTAPQPVYPSGVGVGGTSGAVASPEQMNRTSQSIGYMQRGGGNPFMSAGGPPGHLDRVRLQQQGMQNLMRLLQQQRGQP